MCVYMYMCCSWLLPKTKMIILYWVSIYLNNSFTSNKIFVKRLEMTHPLRPVQPKKSTKNANHNLIAINQLRQSSVGDEIKHLLYLL